jgi:hypothetical protein
MTTMIVNLIKILQLIGKYHAGHVITETVAIGNRQDGSLSRVFYPNQTKCCLSSLKCNA